MSLKIETVTVIGGNGTVGKGVSGIFASFGDAKVYVVARTMEKAEKALSDISLSVKALTIKDNLIPVTYDELKCVLSKSDLIFESVSEDLEVKKGIHENINKYSKEESIIATGTSGLSINDLAKIYDSKKRKRFVGMHFFNPPYSMTLCELIPSDNNDNEYINDLKEYLEKVLFRDVIVVKDQPAFLANRIGFMFMNEALIYAEKYKAQGGIDYIDAILDCYTGRNMAPLTTINFVGLDVHKAIVDNVYNNTSDKESFLLPNFINNLINENKLGIKTKEGLYKMSDSTYMVYDIENNHYREVLHYEFPFKERAIKEFRNANYKEGFNIIKNDDSLESRICMSFLLKYILYSIKLSGEICKNIDDCDIAMAKGFNWIPPHALVDVLGGKDEVISLCDKYLGTSSEYKNILSSIGKSLFGFEKYIKAKD